MWSTGITPAMYFRHKKENFTVKGCSNFQHPCQMITLIITKGVANYGCKVGRMSDVSAYGTK
jgi:hypothetical protein